MEDRKKEKMYDILKILTEQYIDRCRFMMFGAIFVVFMNEAIIF